MTAAQAAIALVRDGATIAEAADQAGLARGEALQAVMADYRGLVKTAHATKAANGHATLDHWLHHPDRRVVAAAEQLRDLTQRIEQNAALTAERQLLVERLAQVDKQLGTPKRPRKQQTPRPCPHCDRILPNAQGLTLHVKAKHQDAS